MGAVHGVYMKYVCLSALSYVGYNVLSTHDAASTEEKTSQHDRTMIPRILLGYSALLNGFIAILFKSERGMFIIGKNKTTGEIPFWSYMLVRFFRSLVVRS